MSRQAASIPDSSNCPPLRVVVQAIVDPPIHRGSVFPGSPRRLPVNFRCCLTLLVLAVPSAASAAADLHFENDILPILGRYGCNSSGCHGKAEGQGGFKLSVFAFDPEADYSALTKEGRGRRVFPAQPDESLLLRKASGRTAHGGGIRIQFNSDDYKTLRGWIGAGLPIGSPDAPHVIALRVEPAEQIMAMKAETALKVIAKLSDGSE